jgi:hypothetical protein
MADKIPMKEFERLSLRIEKTRAKIYAGLAPKGETIADLESI